MGHGHRPWFTLSTPSISHAPGATAGLSKGTTLVWVIEKAFFIFVTQSVQWSLWGSYVWPTVFCFFFFFFFFFTYFTYKHWFPLFKSVFMLSLMILMSRSVLGATVQDACITSLSVTKDFKTRYVTKSQTAWQRDEEQRRHNWIKESEWSLFKIHADKRLIIIVRLVRLQVETQKVSMYWGTTTANEPVHQSLETTHKYFVMNKELITVAAGLLRKHSHTNHRLCLAFQPALC